MQKIKTGIFFNGQNYEPGLVVLSRENAVGLKGLAAFEDRAVPFTCVPIFHEHKHLILPLLIIKKLKTYMITFFYFNKHIYEPAVLSTSPLCFFGSDSNSRPRFNCALVVPKLNILKSGKLEVGKCYRRVT